MFHAIPTAAGRGPVRRWVSAADPPSFLLLGQDALAGFRLASDELSAQVDAWEHEREHRLRQLTPGRWADGDVPDSWYRQIPERRDVS